MRAAADLGHLGVVRVLVDHGVDVNTKGADGVTALTAALERQHLATAVLLLEQGAVIDRTAGGIALCDAIVNDRRAVALVLIDKGADVEGKEGGCYRGLTPLMHVAADRDPELVRALLAKGAAVNARIPEVKWMVAEGGTAEDPAVPKEALRRFPGRTALMAAAESGGDPKEDDRLAVVELLLAQGAEVDARDAKGRTALSFAVERGYSRIAERLRQAGATP
ncbi:ankyrin repeat domain-containing protein [uncultured Lamprocystis sp.]|uniref:ankyrin repeat domain-containing protein n=1 Tax=uncultured Lamprocystis sp. TaxID=543132 RepID=UPI00341C7A92